MLVDRPVRSLSRVRGLPRTVFAELLGAEAMPWESYDEPVGDAGLMGPDSPAWRVLADELSALVGAVGGVIVGTLHPVVLTGTMDHTDLKDDPLGRLARTAAFLRATTFASVPVAERVIAHVNHMHETVVGEMPDGRRYAAGDSDLVIWTHVTVWGGMLEGFQRYNPHPLTAADVDRYWQNIAVIAERLGGHDVPRSRDDIDKYWDRVRPDLAATAAALHEADWIMQVGRWDSWAIRKVLDRLAKRLSPSGRGWRRRIARPVAWPIRIPAFLGARFLVDLARDTIPPWASTELRIRPHPRPVQALRRRVAMLEFGLARLISGEPDHVRRARKRCAASPATRGRNVVSADAPNISGSVLPSEGPERVAEG